ncbi:MAG: hypothetical protein L0Y71_04240 [Gemmataceae bacterium]|nr:hypothetical protein [Gemmataceae bacterium]
MRSTRGSQGVRRRALSIALSSAVILTSAGCGNPGGGAAPAPTLPKPTPPKLEEVKYSDFTFVDAAQRAQLERWTKAARALAGKDWEHRTWFRSSPDSYVYNSWWSAQGDPPQGIPPGKEWHFIRLEAFRATRATLNTKESSRNPREIQAVGLWVAWKPARTGWRADLWHYLPHQPLSHDQDSFGFDLQQVLNEGQPDAGQPEAGQPDTLAWRFRLAEELEFWQTEKVFEDTRYWVKVELPRKVGGGREIPSADIKPWLASADSFRAAGLARLQALKELLEKQLPSGAAVRSATLSTRIGNLPPHDSKRLLTDAERAQLLQEGLSKIEARRRAFVEHAADMHAALVKAFPLRDCLGD